MSCSKTQHSTSGETRTSNPSFPSITLYHCATALLPMSDVQSPSGILEGAFLLRKRYDTNNDGYLSYTVIDQYTWHDHGETSDHVLTDSSDFFRKLW